MRQVCYNGYATQNHNAHVVSVRFCFGKNAGSLLAHIKSMLKIGSHLRAVHFSCVGSNAGAFLIYTKKQKGETKND